ncbi:zinc finger protein 277 isoform X2 [Phyllopteryx taeniolatus]|uniref:zinc finger protein 277 isoform X2 n=1 Tax=Phyllopteryx taeniolatus TaxID=161469 RepID=UPI002AD58F1C|nr:zinc finger protein 277 isoform X2 [Phyllopteryx taeniolatus]
MAASDRSGDGVDHILEPLCFPEQPNPPPPGDPGDPDSHRPSSCRGGAETLSCLFCPESLPATQEDVLLKHLLLQHNLVIADVKLVADLPKYLLYWKGRFLEQPITDFCSEIKTNSTGPVEKQERYFLLCDVLPEDRALREKLQQKRLEEALEQQQKERDDRGFRRVCMFCNDEFAGNRADLLNHMAREHAFSVGLPDNIVYCNELLDTLQSKVDNLQCLYCEKTFKDKMTLKDHMRKKAHRRINPSNRQYDRFYIINYLELGKTWEEVQREDDRELPDDKDDDWSEWRARPVAAVCLFCDLRRDTADDIYAHMKKVHDFDLQHLRAELNLSFYQQVKLVNFIRRQIHQNRCHACRDQFRCRVDVLTHLRERRHATTLPPAAAWNQPQYYFPTYENDALLCALPDSDGEESDGGRSAGDRVPVVGEQNPLENATRRSRAPSGATTDVAL